MSTKTEEKKTSGKLFKALQIGSIAIMLITAVFFVIYLKKNGLSAEDIKNFAPSNVWLAAAAVIFFYVIKSFSLFFPLPILYVAATLIMPQLWQAFIVNFLGVVLSLTMPYYLGKFSGKGLVDKLTSKYPKIRKLDELKSDNEFMLVFILRVSGILSCDLASVLLGAMGITYKKFMWGSVLGFIPMITATTFLTGIADIDSPWFYAGMGGVIILMLGSSLIFKKAANKNKKPE